MTKRDKKPANHYSNKAGKGQRSGKTGAGQYRNATVNPSEATLQKPQAEVTVDPAELDIEKLTPEYFYADVLTGDLATMKIPTVKELAFLGQKNAYSLRAYFRCEEGKLKKARREAAIALATMQTNSPDSIIKHCNIEGMSLETMPYCDWRGLSYGQLPDELGEELMRRGEYETYCAEVDSRMSKVHTCRFGREVAAWCSKNPAPCIKCNCFASRAAVTTNLLTGEKTEKSERLPQCPHYNTCYGVEPLKHERCVFADATTELVADCANYLKNRVADYDARLEFVQKYMHNITTVISTQTAKRPDFDISSLLESMGPRDRVVVISTDNVISRGVFVGMVPRDNDKLYLLYMDDGSVLQIRRKWPFLRPCDNVLCMPETDYNFLLNNPEFLKVWASMVIGDAAIIAKSFAKKLLEAKEN